MPLYLYRLLRTSSSAVTSGWEQNGGKLFIQIMNDLRFTNEERQNVKKLVSQTKAT